MLARKELWSSMTLIELPHPGIVWVACCKKCNAEIVFPHLVSQNGSASRRLSPLLLVIVVCRWCGNRSNYSAKEIKIKVLEKSVQKDHTGTMWRVQVVCNHKGCEEPMEIFTYTESTCPSGEALEYIMRAEPAIYCPKGHKLFAPTRVRSMEALRFI